MDPIDISQWSEPAQGAAVVACFLLGCHIDNAVITGPTYEEWLQSSVAGMMPTPIGVGAITTRAVGGRAQRFVQRVVQQAEWRVLKRGAQGSLAAAFAAAATGVEILPGLFKYESVPTIPGYAQHHLWPQAMGGPKEGWVIYARNVHTAAGGIQDRLNVYLRNQLNMQQRQLEAWARSHPQQSFHTSGSSTRTKGFTSPIENGELACLWKRRLTDCSRCSG
jgi:hypothetical protein